LRFLCQIILLFFLLFLYTSYHSQTRPPSISFNKNIDTKTSLAFLNTVKLTLSYNNKASLRPTDNIINRRIDYICYNLCKNLSPPYLYNQIITKLITHKFRQHYMKLFIILSTNSGKNKSHVNMAIPRLMCLLIGRIYM
jgi:hypothetical protein